MPKKLLTIAGIMLAGIAVVIGTRAVTRQPAPQGSPQRQEERAVDQRATPADRHISLAQAAITRAPKSPDGYNQLAAAYTQKARETGDFGYYARVEAALKRSFEVAPDNHDATRMQSYLLLSYHRFNEALTMARRAVEQKPKDYEAYGAVVDAHVEHDLHGLSGFVIPA